MTEIRPTDEWNRMTPSDKDMGIVQLTLDKGVKTTVVGTVYGLDFEIEGDGYQVNVFFDYYNKRLKILDYQANDYQLMLKRLAYLAEANNFDKIFVKAKADDFQIFLSNGYMLEGVLRYYFKGEDAYILSRFSSQNRIFSSDLIEESKVIEEIIFSSERPKERTLDPNITIIKAEEKHIPLLVTIYREVFATYPSPLTNPDYILSVMNKNVIFRIAFENSTPLAAASAEIDYKHSNAEMTDCATNPKLQGKGLMQFILMELEKDLREKGIMTAYTLARAQSYGMNKVFFRLDYEYSGRLINNCDIFGQFEDMNIWVKRLNK